MVPMVFKISIDKVKLINLNSYLKNLLFYWRFNMNENCTRINCQTLTEYFYNFLRDFKSFNYFNFL